MGDFHPSQAMNGNTQLVRRLLAAGARVHVVNDGGETALDLARVKGHEAAAEALEAAMMQQRSLGEA